jgi:molybdopterin/thiamine biosynthesis adenylyltransferase
MDPVTSSHLFAEHLILDPAQKSDQQKLESLLSQQPTPIIVDTYQNQIKESSKQPNEGIWIFYPWKNTLVHVLEENDFYDLRTNRNFPLISHSTQLKMKKLTVGVVGMSVGNSVALSIIHSGASQQIKIADPDSIDLSNLNRIRTTITNLGLNKTTLAARQISELDPFTKTHAFDEGVNAHNMKSFFLDYPKLDVLIDECDNLSLKFHLRLAARALHIPLVMVTDNGFSVTLEIVRFDLPKQKNSMSNLPELSFEDVIQGYQISEELNLTGAEENELIESLVGKEHLKPEMQQAATLKQNGELQSWPQLGLTSFVGGGIGAYVIKLLAEKKDFNQEKFSLNIPDIFDTQD